jgi:hypothetical protein
VTIIEALDDAVLFAPHFRGDTWAGWRVFLKALFALPLDLAELAIYTEHTGRTDPPSRQQAEAALIVGRRGGKSRILALVAVFLATFRDYTPYLAPGEMGTVAVIAANRPQARAIFRYASGLLKAVGLLAPMIADENTEAITLTNRTVIEISTASFRTVRGATLIACLCDEIAFWRQEETSANPDLEILRALRPGLASVPGSMLLLASSPYAKRGELYAAYRRHFGIEGARVLVWRASTASMNPVIDPEIIAEAYQSDPEAARAEYGAEFRDDLADFVTHETVDAVTMWGRRELPPMPGIGYSAFCDPSGGVSDAMTLAVAHLGTDAVCVLDAALEIRPPFDPEAAVAECSTLLRRFGISRVTGDRYAGEWPVARFREHGIAFEQSARPKSDIYHDLLPLLNAKRVELIDNPRLAAQLVGLERRVGRTGRDSIDHSPGGHDDLANSVAGVLVGLDLDRRPALLRSMDLLTDGLPAPFPVVCDAVFATVVADLHGTVAIVYAARSRFLQPPLVLLDFEVTGLTASLWATTAEHVRKFAETCHARHGACLFLPAELVPSACAAGINVVAIPPELDDAGEIALAVAGYVVAGQVKATAFVLDKARSLPFRAALDFRGGDVADDPLRCAAVLAIALALEDMRAVRRAA